MSYNGWTNYETWLVAVWLDNEEPSYHAVREAVRDSGPRNAAKAIRELVEELVLPPGNGGLAHDLITGALSEVNWSEIAEHYAAEAEDETEVTP